MWAVGRPAFEIIKRSEQLKQLLRAGCNQGVPKGHPTVYKCRRKVRVDRTGIRTL